MLQLLSSAESLGLSALPQASTLAPEVDRLYDFIFWVSLIGFVGVVGTVVYFVLRYRRRSDADQTPSIEGHTPSEIGVSVALLVIVIALFVWGWSDYKKVVASPEDPIEIQVIGRQWLWEVEYPNGRTLVNEVVVPKNRPVQLVMTSADVIHSFYVPNFRLKRDVVPGMYTKLWFEATELGEHDVFCAEYCGTGHSQMLAKVKVLEAEEYERWQSDWEEGRERGAVAEGVTNGAQRGEELFKQKGCVACHGVVAGKVLVGPNLYGVFGKEEEMADGSKVLVDENYIRESLMDPQKKLVKGFPPVMPTFRGSLSDEEVNALVAYLKSLR